MKKISKAQTKAAAKVRLPKWTMSPHQLKSLVEVIGTIASFIGQGLTLYQIAATKKGH